MRTLLVGTDFTPSSMNACLYAAMLAKKLGCKLTVFNLFEVPAVHSNSGLYFISYQAAKESSIEQMARTLEELKSRFPKLDIEKLSAGGSFKKGIEDFIEHHRVEAVVLGLAVKTKLSKFIYGSHTTDIAGRVKAPVIIVPEQYKKHQFRSVLLGVDNPEKLTKTQLQPLDRMLSDAKAKVKLLHVRTQHEIFHPEKIKHPMAGASGKIETFFARDIADGLVKYSGKNTFDTIAIISRYHSAFYDLFAESTTKKVAFVSKKPVMAIHE